MIYYFVDWLMATIRQGKLKDPLKSLCTLLFGGNLELSSLFYLYDAK